MLVKLTKAYYEKEKVSSLVCTECVTDLDQQSELIIFESLLTTFEASVIF